MSYTRFNDDMMIIRRLGDAPNDENGLSAADLKAKFDEAGERIKTFLNAHIDELQQAEQSGTSVRIDGMDEASVADVADDTRFAVSVGGANATLTLRQLKHLIPGVVLSVNGKTGNVVLTAKDVGAFAPEEDGSLVVKNMISVYTEDEAGFHMMAAGTAEQPVIELGSEQDGEVIVRKVADPQAESDAVNLRTMQEYVAEATPADAVTSVNGKTGAVELGAADVGAVPSTGGEFTGEVRFKGKGGTGYVRVNTDGALEFNDTQADNGFYAYADEGTTDRPVMSFYGSNSDSPVALRNVAEPTQSNEAATKGYVDARGAGYVDVTEAYEASGLTMLEFISTLDDGLYRVGTGESDVSLCRKTTSTGVVWVEELLLTDEFYYYSRWQNGELVDYLSPQEEDVVMFGGKYMATMQDVEDAVAGIGGGGSGESNVVIVEAIPDIGLSMTAAEIYAAKQAGKVVILCGAEPENALLLYAAENFAIFGGPKGTEPNRMGYTIVTDNGVFGDSFTAQSVANLVTALSAESTDEQYPSAKAVYDALQNAGGGGGGVQADWNQNDETQPDYVKGRTHYSEYSTEPCTLEIPYNQYVVAADDIDFANVLFSNPESLRYYLDGVEHELAYEGFNGNSLGWYGAIGNEALYVYVFLDEESGLPNGNIRARGVGDWSLITLTAEKIIETVHKIDNKYFDIAQPDWSVDDPSTPGYIANKPEGLNADWLQSDEKAESYVRNRTHWQDYSVVYGDWGTIEFAKNPTSITNSIGGTSYTLGANVEPVNQVISGYDVKTYDIDWFGKTYRCTSAEVGGVMCVGNFALLKSTTALEDTGEPFCIRVDVWYNYIGTVYTTEQYETIEVSARTVDETFGEVHPLDEKYLPDSVKPVVVELQTADVLAVSMNATEIAEANAAGKTVMLVSSDGGLQFPLWGINNGIAYFGGIVEMGVTGYMGFEIDADGNVTQTMTQLMTGVSQVAIFQTIGGRLTCSKTAEEIFNYYNNIDPRGMPGIYFGDTEAVALQMSEVNDVDGPVTFTAVRHADDGDTIECFVLAADGTVTHTTTPVGGGGGSGATGDYVPAAGGTFTGDVFVKIGNDYVRLTQGGIEINNDSTENGFYINSAGDADEPLAEFIGSASDAPVRLTNLAAPKLNSDAVTKGYVDSLVGNAAAALAAMDGIIGGDA